MMKQGSTGMPVGECKTIFWYSKMHGNKSIRSWNISNRIPYSVDTKISAQNPESRNEWVHKKTFPENIARDAGSRDDRIKYTS